MAKITLHPDFRVGEISPRLFGAFLEPIGSMVNGCMFDPEHPSADEQGLRKDFYTALRDAGLPCVRLPGGNFVSGWQWKNSVGPAERRRAAPDLAWHQIITNQVGHDEYLGWAEKAGAEPMYTLNLGTGTLQDAMNLVEYTRMEGGTYWSDLRRENGREQPWPVNIWYLGNEMDGPWQIGSYERDPHAYGVLAHEVSKAVKWTAPGALTAACVSSSPFLSHYPEWDRTVLEQCYETVDLISLHHYHSALPGDTRALMAGCMAYENYIRTEIALCDYMQTHLRSGKKMMLSLDEYAAFYRPGSQPKPGMNGRVPADSFCNFDRNTKFVKHDPHDWSTRREPPRMPEMEGVLATLSVTLTLLRHADRVKIGCATSGLNLLCAADRDHVWKPASYYPMTQLLRYAKGVSLQPTVNCPVYDVPGYTVDDMNQYAGFEQVPTVTCAAALNAEQGELSVFVINADPGQDQPLTLDLRGFDGLRMLEHLEMASSDPAARNTFNTPDAILPRPVKAWKEEKGIVMAEIRKMSWNLFRFSVK